MLRAVNMLVLVVCGVAWATLLVVGGAILATAQPGFGPWTRANLILAGLSGVGAGFFVFEVIVADRLFPRADRRLVAPVEFGSGALLVAGAVGAVVSLIAST